MRSHKNPCGPLDLLPIDSQHYSGRLAAGIQDPPVHQPFEVVDDGLGGGGVAGHEAELDVVGVGPLREVRGCHEEGAAVGDDYLVVHEGAQLGVEDERARVVPEMLAAGGVRPLGGPEFACLAGGELLGDRGVLSSLKVEDEGG